MIGSEVVEPRGQDGEDKDVIEGHHSRGVMVISTDEPDLPERVGGRDQADRGIVAIRGENVDGHPAEAQEEQRVTGISPVEDHLTGTELTRPSDPHQRIPRRGGERRERVFIHNSMESPASGPDQCQRSPDRVKTPISSESHMSGNGEIEIAGNGAIETSAIDGIDGIDMSAMCGSAGPSSGPE